MFGKWREKCFLLAVSARISNPFLLSKHFEYLSEHDGYIPAPYFANRGMKWIQQTETSGVLDEELKYYLSESYRLVVLGLSKRLQKELGITSRADGESAS